jgi:hypothetical protein
MNETTSFCVVCILGNNVIASPHWEVTQNERADKIAQEAAHAAETFGEADFDVRVVEIKS